MFHGAVVVGTLEGFGLHGKWYTILRGEKGIGGRIGEILRCAKEEEASLIFLSSHGSGWLHTLLQGEKSIDVVMHAKRPVLVVRVNSDLS